MRVESSNILFVLLLLSSPSCSLYAKVIELLLLTDCELCAVTLQLYCAHASFLQPLAIKSDVTSSSYCSRRRPNLDVFRRATLCWTNIRVWFFVYWRSRSKYTFDLYAYLIWFSPWANMCTALHIFARNIRNLGVSGDKFLYEIECEMSTLRTTAWNGKMWKTNTLQTSSVW